MAEAFHKRLALCATLTALLALGGCFGGNKETTSESVQTGTETGGSWIPFLGGDKEPQGPSIGVNSYLWRATLDTLAFMPLQSADPFGGVVISDWYEDPTVPGERFKVTVYILDQRLRADGIKVAVFKQGQSSGRGWVDAPVSPNTAADIENAILTRARQLRVDSIESN